MSDNGMPGEDGYSLIRRVRKLNPAAGGQTPVLALTAYARSEDRTKAILTGFQLHAAKPARPSELIAMVASLAGRAEMPVEMSALTPPFQPLSACLPATRPKILAGAPGENKLFS